MYLQFVLLCLQLDEIYSVVLSRHGESPSTLGEAIRVNITILKNDDPHGVIEFISPGIVRNINESKGNDIYYGKKNIVIVQKDGKLHQLMTLAMHSLLDVCNTRRQQCNGHGELLFSASYQPKCDKLQ